MQEGLSRAAKPAQWRLDHPWGGVCIASHGRAQRPQEQSRVAFSGCLPQVISQVRPNGSCTPGTSLTGPGPAVVSMEAPGRCHGPLGAQSAHTSQSLEAAWPLTWLLLLVSGPCRRGLSPQQAEHLSPAGFVHRCLHCCLLLSVLVLSILHIKSVLTALSVQGPN